MVISIYIIDKCPEVTLIGNVTHGKVSVNNMVFPYIATEVKVVNSLDVILGDFNSSVLIVDV